LVAADEAVLSLLLQKVADQSSPWRLIGIVWKLLCALWLLIRPQFSSILTLELTQIPSVIVIWGYLGLESTPGWPRNDIMGCQDTDT